MKDLENKIKQYRKQNESSSKKHINADYSRLLVDLVSGLVVGAVLGYFIDKSLNTLPIMLFICTLLGISGGFYNFYKYIKASEQKETEQGD